MSNGEPDNPGIKVPSPLIYLLPLLLGLILHRRSHFTFLPSGVVRIIGWPLIGGGCSLEGGGVKPCARPRRLYAPRGPCRG